jgi:hypothetical protein
MKLVLVEWVDSYSMHGWKPLDNLIKECEPLLCRSVGWLASKKNGHVLIVPHLSGEQNEGITVYGTGDITIPAKAIRKMTVLREK